MTKPEYPKSELDAAFRQSALDLQGSPEGRRVKALLDLLVQVRLYEAANAEEADSQFKKGRYREARDLRSKLFPQLLS